ncbi:MAG: transporter substrate-binding domain-containing protein [Sneathiellales bacterium]|nr:transporter substrate-binding domain-containing protein [Sneathiellales bacterium]
MKYIAQIVVAIFLLASRESLAAERITVVADLWAPYVTVEDGKVSGISTDLVLRALKKADIPYTLRILPWSRAYEMALNEKNILIFTLVRTQERLRKFKWAARLHPNVPAFLYGLKSSRIGPINSLQDAKKYSVAAPRSSYSAQRLIASGFQSQKNFVETKDGETAFKMMINSRVDLLAEASSHMDILLKQSNISPDRVKAYIQIEDVELYTAFSLKTEDKLVEKFTRAIKAVKTELNRTAPTTE